LELRVADRVLHDPPGRLGAIVAYEVMSGPPSVRDDFLKPARILGVYRFHARVVPALELAELFQLVTHACVCREHGKQLVA
jgi:hypothetical protein